MMNFWLLQAIGDIDPDLVERAAQPPRKAHPLRWVAAVAAAVVMVAGLGLWWNNTRPENKPPVTHSTNPTNESITATTVGGVITASTTTTTTITTTVTTTEPTTQPTTTPDNPPDTGGDDKSCVVHSLLYHSIPVGPDTVGQEVYDAFMQAYRQPIPDPDLTYPFTECNYPECNIVDFVKFTGITQEEFIASAWDQDWIASVGGVEAFLDMPYDFGNPYSLFTYGDYFDAIYGDDPHLTAWVFHRRAANVLDDPDYPYQ